MSRGYYSTMSLLRHVCFPTDGRKLRRTGDGRQNLVKWFPCQVTATQTQDRPRDKSPQYEDQTVYQHVHKVCQLDYVYLEDDLG